MATAKLRKIDTIKSLKPDELELLNWNFWAIEQALSSVNASTPGSTGTTTLTVPIKHDQLQELNDDDHLQYLLLNGRSGQIINDSITVNQFTTLLNTLTVKSSIDINRDNANFGRLQLDGNASVFNLNFSNSASVVTAAFIGNTNHRYSFTGRLAIFAGGSDSLTNDSLTINKLAGQTGRLLRINDTDQSTIISSITSDGYFSSKRLLLNGTTSGTLTHIPAATTTSYSLTWPAASIDGVLTNTGGILSWGAGGGVGTHSLLDSAVHTDTLTGSVVLGDMIYGNATPKWQRLIGNASTTKKFLTQTGTGAVSAAPIWDTLVSGDIPDISSIYVTKGTTQTITGDKTFDCLAGGIPTFLTDNGLTPAFYISNGVNGLVILLPNIVGDQFINFPNLTGEVVLTMGSQNINSKIFLTGCSAVCGSSSTGFSFQDSGTNTKRLRIILLNAVGNNTITINTTAARNYDTLNSSGSLPVVVAPASTGNFTAKTAAISATTVFTTTHAGWYKIEAYTLITAFTALGTITVRATWTDPERTNTNYTFSTLAYTADSQNSQVDGVGPHYAIMYCTSGSVIQISTTFSGTCTYSTYIRVTDLS